MSLAGCGVTHGCFTYPPDCRIESCESVAQWQRPENGKVRVTLQTTNDWVALGFSNDAAMVRNTFCNMYQVYQVPHVHDNAYTMSVSVQTTYDIAVQ